MLLACQELFHTGDLLKHIGITLAETFGSFFLVASISLLIAILLCWNTTLSEIFEPYFVILNSLPKSAMAPIFIVWLGNNMKTIIITAISVAIFGSILNTATTEQMECIIVSFFVFYTNQELIKCFSSRLSIPYSNAAIRQSSTIESITQSILKTCEP